MIIWIEETQEINYRRRIMNKYKYNIVFERRSIDGEYFGKDYTTIEASSFDSVIKKFIAQYGDCEIIEIIRL